MQLKSTVLVLAFTAAVVYSAALPDEEAKVIASVNSVWMKAFKTKKEAEVIAHVNSIWQNALGKQREKLISSNEEVKVIDNVNSAWMNAFKTKKEAEVIAHVNSIWQNALGKQREKLISLAGSSNKFNYAIDTQYASTQQNFNCLYNYGYSLAFLRIYSGQGTGQTDSNGIQNVKYAVNAGFGFEVYVEPSPASFKSPDTQFNEALNFAKNNGLKLNRVWLKVSSPIMWDPNTYNNVNWINNFIKAAKNSGLSVGIFTNWYDWSLITSSSSQVYNIYALWYWNQNGFGTKGETSKDASDFIPFGPFSSAMIKQFGISENICNTNVNVNIYASSVNFEANSIV